MADFNTVLASLSSLSPAERVTLLDALVIPESVQLNEEDTGHTGSEAVEGGA